MANLNAFPFDASLIDGVYDREYTSDDYASYFGKFIGNGIYAKNGNCLEVMGDNNSMFVTVRDGSVFINGRARDWQDSQQIRLSNAHDRYNRYDLIVARLSIVNRNITIEVIEGTPADSPIVPDITRTDDTFDLLLAQVLVKTGVTAIGQSDITDKRSTSLCGFVTGLLDQIDAESFFEQYERAFSQEFDEYQAEFVTWFNSIKNILGDDEVAMLLAEFEAFKQEIYQAVANLPQYDLMMQEKTVTFTSGGWKKDATNGYYTQSVEVVGLTTMSTPVVSLNANGTKDDMVAQVTEWGKMLTHATGSNSLTLYSSELPLLDLSVSVKTTIDTDIDEFRAEMSELKKSVSDGKSAVADAITAKGVTTANDATFAQMATNINNIQKAVGTASNAQVLSGYTFSNNNAVGANGTMKNNGAVSKTFKPSTTAQAYTIPAGYHNGSGKVTFEPMTDRGAVTKTFTPSNSAQSYTIPEGYHNGSGKVSVAKIPDKTVTSGKLYLPKTASFASGSVPVGTTVPIKPTSIKAHVGNANANASSRTWYFNVEGLRNGTSTWDSLASKSIVLSADGENGDIAWVDQTFSVSASYYYSEFRVSLVDMNRMLEESYIQVTGAIAW